MVSTATFGGRFAANFSPSIAVGIRTRIFDPVSSVFRFRMWTETSKAIRSSSTRNHHASVKTIVVKRMELQRMIIDETFTTFGIPRPCS